MPNGFILPAIYSKKKKIDALRKYSISPTPENKVTYIHISKEDIPKFMLSAEKRVQSELAK